MADSASWSADVFTRLEIEKMNNKGNLLSFSDSLDRNHLHISHGQIGEEVVVFQGPETISYGNRLQAPVLPFDSVELAVQHFGPETTLHISEGDLLKLMDPNGEGRNISLTGFNVQELQLAKAPQPTDQVTVRIGDVEGTTAHGQIVESATKPEHKISTHKPKRRRSVSSRRDNRNGGKGNGKNPFKSGRGSKNDLLRGNLR